MIQHRAAEMLQLTACGILLILSFRRLLRPALFGAFRHELFTLRRHLFLLVADGRLPAKHPANVRLRTLCNGMAVHAQDVSLATILMAGLFERNADRPPALVSAIETIEDEELRAQCFDLAQRAGLIIFVFSVALAPWSWALLLLLPIAFAVLFLAHKTMKRVFDMFVQKRTGPILDAYSSGYDDSTPLCA